jgi:cytidylate kinase
MVIAIDGPAGAGKSTVARSVAQRLGYAFLDTGAMYRCVGLAAEAQGKPPAEVANAITIELGAKVLLDGRDVTAEIRAPKVSDAASRVAADPEVRAALVRQQQAILDTGDWVAEGRDITTVVAPHADVKVFLYADPNERARRRAAENGLDLDHVLKLQRERDERDSTEGRSTLEAPLDAVPIDTTGRPLDEVIDQIVMLATEIKEIDA